MDIVEAAARAPALAISWGTIAQYVGKGKLERNDSHTHKWMVFLRGAHNQDLSYAISKVTFQLHRDYENYRREVTAPPYQVCETGWGGFDICIDIQMRDPALPVMRLTHYLKLYSDGAGPSSSQSAADRPVVSEQFDELVFNALPSDPALRAALLRGPAGDAPPYPYAEHMGLVSSEADLVSIAAARKWVADRVEELEERLLRAKASAAALRQLHLGM